MTDAADKAHDHKVKATASGERLVEQPAFTDADRELRAVQDEAEVDRVESYRETGYVAAPGVGDYHATRRAAKLTGAAMGGVTGEFQDDPAALVVDQVKDAVGTARKDAARARQAGRQDRSETPRGRRTPQAAQTGGDGGGDGGGDSGSGSSGSGSSGSGSGSGSTPAKPTKAAASGARS